MSMSSIGLAASGSRGAYWTYGAYGAVSPANAGCVIGVQNEEIEF